MVNLKKISKMETASFKNGLRLHFDAIHLFKNTSYPSAFFMSVLSQEEFGKAYWLGDFVWNSSVNGRMEAKWEKKYLDQIYSHTFKQGHLKRNSWDLSYSVPGMKTLQKIYDGDLDILKQNAMYVGLKRKKGKIDISSKIINPLKMDRKIAERQVTAINDFLIILIAGVRKGYYSYDNEIVDAMLTTKLLNKLNKIWKVKSSRARQRLRKIVS